ncbi:MAG: hypothetical protein GSR73_06170 [Desulfurococcales archaeon]|nr:hypothetical protein [Desulfurococcales archaeon]
MSFVRVKLLPRSMLGRRFQYAFASLSIERVEVRYESDEMIFPDETSYVNTVKLALKNILDVYTQSNPLRDCKPSTAHGIDCCRLRGGPKLYGNDYNDIKRMGLGECPYITTKGKAKYTWTHLAVSYALKVIERKGPLRDPEEFGVPSLAKATLFSKIRGIGAKTETKEIKVDKDAIGTMLLGGSLSFLGSYNVSRRGRDQMEFYLLPDIPGRTYSTILQIASIQDFSNNLAALTTSLLKNLGVSMEAALTLAIAVLLYRNEELVSGIEGGAESLVSGVKLYTVSPSGNRPQLRSGIPLSLALYKTYTKRSIQLVNGLAHSRSDIVKSAARECIHDMFLQSVSPCNGSFIVDCGRILAAVTQERDLNKEILGMASSLLKSLDREYSRILQECGTA